MWEGAVGKVEYIVLSTETITDTNKGPERTIFCMNGVKNM